MHIQTTDERYLWIKLFPIIINIYYFIPNTFLIPTPTLLEIVHSTDKDRKIRFGILSHEHLYLYYVVPAQTKH